MSLKRIILEHLKKKYPEIVHKGEIGRLAVNQWGYENENSGRRCRELAEAGLIERIENKKGEVMYKYKLNEKNSEKENSSKQTEIPPSASSIPPRQLSMLSLRFDQRH